MLRAIIMGVAGCGKTSVGLALAPQLGAIYRDGDDLHPPENIAKMSAGDPLNDADRAPWLDLVGHELASSETPIIIGCSALKRAYRDRIRAIAGDVVFIHLSGARLVIENRMAARSGHFMPVALLDSQFAALEQLSADELGIVIDIDQPLADVVTNGRDRILALK
ncbi:gluconate kinase IdnK [Rhodobacteraceae bacterium HTCC2150]|nr:gluconate kinase IdnK [Rhodobacteraceae bacterium HTCC2150]